MTKIFFRILVMVFLFFLAHFAGWEKGLAGIIFLLALEPEKYDYLILGPALDLSFSFPMGFFSVTLTLFMIAGVFFIRYFKDGSLSGLFTKIVLLFIISVFSIIGFAGFDLKLSEPETLKILSSSLYAIAFSLALFSILYKFISFLDSDVGKENTK